MLDIIPTHRTISRIQQPIHQVERVVVKDFINPELKVIRLEVVSMVTSEVHSRINIFKTGKVTHLCICDELNIKYFDKKLIIYYNKIILCKICSFFKLHGSR